ncbi:MAG: Nif3-like dinuclear metal center hexameric protein [Chloroflexi bacterium]|nr:Nif3-like dinuclear metal center hexameric protein [Chloroflexota bacterium]
MKKEDNMERTELTNYLDEYLRIAAIKDYGPQGLQVEADNVQINRIALAVDTAPAVIEAAAAWNADMLLVHHGVLWRSVERIAGPLGWRVRLLLQHGINLYAAHIPLDAHPEVGNNAVLARMFGVEIAEWWGAPTGVPLGVIGTVAGSPSLEQLTAQIERQLNCRARVLAHGPDRVDTMAIMSGFGAEDIAEAKALGADTYLTGETSHANYWAAADHGLNLIYAGHYATETVGVQALGQHLADKFELDVNFFDFPTEM